MAKIRLNREYLLQVLRSVECGVSPSEVVEQSSCFVFQDGQVVTFNDEVACRRALNLGFDGAVPASPFVSLLDKLTEDDLIVEASNGELLVRGKGRIAGIRMEKDIFLPINSIESPKKWRDLSEDFLTAVSMACQCASRDLAQFCITCVHISPKWIESSDNMQLTRYYLDTGVSESALVRSSAIKHIVDLGMDKISETRSWIHFKNNDNLVVSCRKYVEDFPDLSVFLDVKGERVSLPKGLSEAVDKANIFSSEDDVWNRVLVDIRPGTIRVMGEGAKGWYKEVKNINYKGRSLKFYIAPDLLIQLTEKYNESIVSENRLKVEGHNYVYVTVLEAPGTDDDKQEEAG